MQPQFSCLNPQNTFLALEIPKFSTVTWTPQFLLLSICRTCHIFCLNWVLSSLSASHTFSRHRPCSPLTPKRRAEEDVCAQKLYLSVGALLQISLLASLKNGEWEQDVPCCLELGYSLSDLPQSFLLVLLWERVIHFSHCVYASKQHW